jgi:hypothetical protein
MLGAMCSLTFFLYDATVDGASRSESSQPDRYSPTGVLAGSVNPVLSDAARASRRLASAAFLVLNPRTIFCLLLPSGLVTVAF